MLLNSKILSANSNDVDQKSTEIERLEAERQKKADVSSDKLVKSITDLNKTLLKVEKDAARQKTKGETSTFGGMIREKITDIKKLTTGSGLFGTLAQKTSNPVVSAIFGSLSERSAKKEAEKEKLKQFVSTVATGTKFGRQLTQDVGAKQAAETIKELYKEKSKLETKIYARKEMRSTIQEKGKEVGVNADLDEKQLKELEQWEQQLTEFKDKLDMKDSKPKNPIIMDEETPTKEKSEKSQKPLSQPEQDTTVSSMQDEQFKMLKEELKEAIFEGMQAEYDALPEEDKKALDKMHPERRAGITEGIFKELESISKEQLEQLIKISDSLDGDKEKELESRLKPALQVEKQEKKEKKEEEKSTLEKLFGSFDKLKSLFDFGKLTPIFAKIGSAITAVGPLLGSLASILGPVAAVIGAAGVGVFAGDKLNKFIEEKTGKSVGNHAYDAADSTIEKVENTWLGKKFGDMTGIKSDKRKMYEADKKAAQDFIDSKIAKGEKIAPNFAKDVKAKYGIDIDKKHVGEIQPQKQPDSAQKIREIDNNLIQKNEEKTHTALVIEKQSESIENKEAEQKKTPVVISAPTNNNISNNTTKNIVRPPIRNTDPSWLQTEQRRLAY